MVLLRQPQQSASRKRAPSSSSAMPPPKIPKPTPPSSSQFDKMVSVLANAGCTLINPSGPPCLPSRPHNFGAHLNRLFSSSDNAPAVRSDFVAAFSAYIQSPQNLRRVLTSSNRDGFASQSLVRHLLLVPPIQFELQQMLLEKLPEYFHVHQESLLLEDDVARLIINQFRWLDFIVHPIPFTAKLMELLSICPIHLKKEIIGSLPEIIGDHNSKAAVDSLQQMLEEDSGVIVPVLDAFSNLHLDEMLQEQVITTALSCIRTTDGEHMPYLLRFLLLSATPVNVRRIISQIREKLKFIGVSNYSTQNRKLKGKSIGDNTEASILDVLRSSLLFKNMLCQEILKELNSIHKPQDHKVIDIWLLVLIYMNGEAMQKCVHKIFKKKIVDKCFQEVMIDQIICGNKELVQDYFPSLLSLSEYLLSCKEQKAREFGTHLYTCLFGELGDTYCRQEVLGALVTHVGSGISSEVNSALDTLALLASKYAQELIPLFSHINGILDYLEGFGIEALHKVYEVFSQLALSARSTADSFGSSIANELLIIIRKQVNHSDLKYRKMGLIGTLRMVSCLGDANTATSASAKKSNCEDALELLRTSLDSCKQLCLLLVLFCDELTAMLHQKKLEPAIMEWSLGNQLLGCCPSWLLSKLATVQLGCCQSLNIVIFNKFESVFLSDIEDGQLPAKDTYCDLEGKLWMNLDGDLSPICLRILSLISSSSKCSSLQLLPANFLLLSTVERLSNHGSLGGIDALLGCPLQLPSSKYFSEFISDSESLSEKQKQILCFSLYYAINWIRELLNAFCSQVAGGFECTSQTTKKDVIAKLLKRLRNLVFMESLLDHCIKCYPLSLPELHLHIEHSGTPILNDANDIMHVEKKNGHTKAGESTSQAKRENKKILKASSSGTDGKLRQPTILDMLRKSGALTSQEVSNGNSTSQSSKGPTFSSDQDSSNTLEPISLQVSAFPKALEPQRFKFRPLHIQCLSLLTFSIKQESCCFDPAAELPLYLYLLRDLHWKLDDFTGHGKHFLTRYLDASGGKMTVEEFLSKIRPLFPYLKKHFDSAFSFLKEGDETCEEHWKVHSAFAGNPDIANVVLPKSSVSFLVFKEVLHCLTKMLLLPDIHMHKSVLLDLLKAFQPRKISECFSSGIDLSPLPGTIEYLYLGASSFVEDVLNTACSFSFMLASESLLALESVVASVQLFVNLSERNGQTMQAGSPQKVLSTLRGRLGSSARKLLSHDWDNGSLLENGWKNKGEIVQKMLRVYLENSESKSDLLDELACSVLPQVSASSTLMEDGQGFPTLCSATFVVWYRVLHEVNLIVFNNLVKEVGSFVKRRVDVELETVEKCLIKIQQSVNAVVSLVNLCKTHDKVTVRAMAVKYGGKFVTSFLKVFDFLQAHFQTHNELVIEMVRELQKATRTIQTLCSEAKGMKQVAITSKIPATKRSLERLLFCVNFFNRQMHALFGWDPLDLKYFIPVVLAGNLKHKDLTGQVVSSQVYIEEQEEQDDDNQLEGLD